MGQDKSRELALRPAPVSRGSFALIALLLLAALAAPDVGAAHELGRLEGMEHFAGSPAARRLLARQGFVVTDQEFRQIFSAYVESPLPKFVTTDSAWHTYHVLLEEGLRQLEKSQAEKLREFSQELLDALLTRTDGNAGPYADLALFAAVGLRLQDGEAPLPPELAVRVAPLVENIEAADGQADIPFLEVPLVGELFRVAGFYEGSAELSGYFAARHWYALCNFRAKSEAETERAVLLAFLIDQDPQLEELWAYLSDPYDALLAPPEDGDVRSYVRIARQTLGGGPPSPIQAADLRAICRDLCAQLPAPRINDQLLEPSQYMNAAGELTFAKETKGFRLFPPRRLPSAVLFQNTVHPIVKDRMYPSVIDLAAAGPMASEAGKRALKASTKDEKTVRAILAAEAAPPPDSLHGQTLELLARLQEPLPQAAPAPLRTKAWHDKQLWTQLGAWAEQRHTWALHAKLTAHYIGMGAPEHAGIVSPYPDFFAGLGSLARATAEQLSRFEDEGATDVPTLGKRLKEVVEYVRMRRRPPDERGQKQYSDLVFEGACRLADRMAGSGEEKHQAIVALGPLADRALRGDELTPEERSLLSVLEFDWDDIPGMLREFAEVCDSLATIASKQLAGEELTPEQTGLFRRYGATLARFHFYGGGSSVEPRDDFPLVSRIFHSPITGRFLYAGVGRPQALYVIVEIDGSPVLHRGGVLGYREFTSPASQPVSDASWRGQVGAGEVPPPPGFTRSFHR